MIILVVAGGTIVYISLIALLCSCRGRTEKIKVIGHEQVAQTTEMNQDDAKDSQKYDATSIELEEHE